MNDQALQNLIARYPTPFYVFDIGVLKKRIHTLREQLPQAVELCYAIKANTFVIKEIAADVDRFEVCSPGEYNICKSLGLPLEKLVISGVYKTPAFIETLVEREPSIGHYTVESLQQFHLLRNVAVRTRHPLRLLLRLTSDNQFGLNEADLCQIVRDYAKDEAIVIAGIQYFSGTQKGSLKKLRRELQYVDAFLQRFETAYDFRAPELEFGAGLPVYYFEGETFDEPAFLATFSEMLEELQTDAAITVELGRSIVASCGTYVTKVVDAKQNHGQNYAIVDGGMHQLVYYGQSMAMKHPLHTVFHRFEEDVQNRDVARDMTRDKTRDVDRDVVQDEAREEMKPWTIFGSLCTTNDILVKQLPIQNLQIGDAIAFDNTGAYCMTEGISLFLSRDLPTILSIDPAGHVDILRERFETQILNTPHYEVMQPNDTK